MHGPRKLVAILGCLLLTCLPGLAQTSMPTQASEGEVTPSPLTNQDILEMLNAGIGQAIILAKIRAGPSRFDTSPVALQRLKGENVPDDILLAMVEASSVSPTGSEDEGTASSLAAVVPLRSETAQARFELPDGTPVEIELVENISSEAVQEGSVMDFTVVQPVEVHGVTVIARGAPARGRVMEVKKARHWGRAGKLVWAIQDVHAVDGQRIPLRLSKELEGGGSSGKVAAAVVATAIVFWPAAPLWGLKKGKPAILPAGTRVSSFVHGNATVEALAKETGE